MNIYIEDFFIKINYTEVWLKLDKHDVFIMETDYVLIDVQSGDKETLNDLTITTDIERVLWEV